MPTLQTFLRVSVLPRRLLMPQLIECVPNFSEGRDMGVIGQITDAIEAVEGVTLLDVDPGASTNRTVVTFVGEPEAVVEAAYQAIRVAARGDRHAQRITARTRGWAPPTSARWCRCRVSRWTRWSARAPAWQAGGGGAGDPRLPLRGGGDAARAQEPGDYPRRGVRGAARQAAGPCVVARFRPGGLQRENRGDGDRCARFPGRVQREPEYHVDAAGERRGVRRAGARACQA